MFSFGLRLTGSFIVFTAPIARGPWWPKGPGVELEQNETMFYLCQVEDHPSRVTIHAKSTARGGGGGDAKNEKQG